MQKNNELKKENNIPADEEELAKIMLVNLPNASDMISGFRIYDGKLVMVAQNRNIDDYGYLPVSDIVSYLKEQDISKIRSPDNQLVKGLTKIMKDILCQFQDNAFRLYGFDGVYNYLKWAMKKDGKDYAIDMDLNKVKSIDLTPTEEEFEHYRITERILGYNFGLECGLWPLNVDTKDIAGFINEQRKSKNLNDGYFGGKWCTSCNNPKKPCPYTKDTESKRRISFDISENGKFQDYGAYKK